MRSPLADRRDLTPRRPSFPIERGKREGIQGSSSPFPLHLCAREKCFSRLSRVTRKSLARTPTLRKFAKVLRKSIRFSPESGRKISAVFTRNDRSRDVLSLARRIVSSIRKPGDYRERTQAERNTERSVERGTIKNEHRSYLGTEFSKYFVDSSEDERFILAIRAKS